ncbi:alpha/beta hydrolase family protein [Aspergillus terreus]|uniref:Alpha/beta hydrolase family protein n=1 Tax=Aspergillus terreus TaxID=33178 RepID=A0A5M3Z1K2_ASPTE|nr:hypothetical protein ATETN484_0007046700 [Aspergillus terreus]GFF16272.1 alpha/beta hydrolase family protein [Aspergillus terreus]
MAEKRRLSARDRREPAAKRRVSEATPQPQPQATSKKKASTPAAVPSPPPPPTPEVVEKPLPTKLKDGEGLPITDSPQPQNLSPKEYQSIAESAVLLASLERSKKKWLSDGILVRYWTKPKKTKREQIEGKNPPKDTMSKVGACSIVVGPHLFDAMLYTVKDPNAPPPIQYTPPQRPMVHYGHSNNFQQYHHPYPHQHPSQHARQHPQHSPANAPSPQPGYHQGQATPSHQARTPSHPQRAPSGPQSAQRPSPAQPNQPPQPAKPSPDPVIQMLATRAASDPELKALMRVVASSKASQEQLRAFQAHIDELNAIIRAREQHQLRQQQQQQQQQGQSSTPQTQASRTPQQAQHVAPPQPTPSPRPPQPPTQPGKQESQPQQKTTTTPKPQQPPQTPQQPQTSEQRFPRVEVQVPKPSPSLVSTPQPSTPNPTVQVQIPPPQKPSTTPQVKQEPGATPSQASHPPPAAGPPSSSKPASPAVQPMPPPQQPPAASPRPGPPFPSYQQGPYQGQQPALQSRPPQYGSPASHYRQAPPPPPRQNYKSVVFEFTSPLTPYGSSTSGHAGSGDRYLFPEYSILEWLPGGNTVLASFLLVRKVDPNTPFPIETGSETGNSRAKGKSSKSKKADKSKGKNIESEKGKDSTSNQSSTPATDAKENATQATPAGGPAEKSDDKAAAPSGKQADKEASTDKPEDAKKADNLKEYYQPVTFRIHSTNPKVLEPLGRVVKPPDEVRKYMNEIMDRAERAPDGFLAFRLPREEPDEPEAEDSNVKKGGTPVPTVRSRLSKSKTVDNEESDIENRENPAEDEEEEELLDYYGPPMGLVPMGV